MNIHFGVDYYPEHWPRERWKTDAELMQKMGVQMVRMGEFSWFKMEPEKGKYDFGWLDEAIELLGSYGIKTVLGTPTAAPPAWIVQENPDIQPMDMEGHIRHFGGRHHTCHSNSEYREHCHRIVTAMAKHFAENENVIGWQPDNELGNSQEALCRCASCEKHFQNWLKQKYETVENLNESWGTGFWSQSLNNFEQVTTPKLTPNTVNPSKLLDWKCFCSDLIVDFLQLQIDILRENCPKHFITHNFMGFADKVNYYDLGQNLDFVSHDQYPGGFYCRKPHLDNSEMAATLDIIRAYKNATFWIMEQQSGITGWEIMGRTPEPGQLSLWAAQSVAHGADVIVFFRWRSCAIGTEQYWHGILPHSGKPGRIYDELKELTADLTPIMEDMQGAMPQNKAAIVFDFRQKYAMDIQPHNPELSYMQQVLKYYAAFYEKGISVDFVQGTQDLSQYALVVAPLQYLMTEELEKNYFNYVEQGGHLVLTMRTGVKDENNLVMTDRPLPGKLADLLGITVEEYDCLIETSGRVTYGEKEYAIYKWSDVLNAQSAEILAVYASGYYKGQPAVTRNAFGKGIAYYIGTEPGEVFMGVLLEDILKKAHVICNFEGETGVEFCTRSKGNDTWLFVLNHKDTEICYKVPEGYQIIKGKNPGVLKAYEVHVLKKSAVERE